MNNHVIPGSGGLLAVAFAILLSGRLSAGESDTKTEKEIEAFGGCVNRDPDAPGMPIVSVYIANKKVTDADLKYLAGIKSLHTLFFHGNTQVTDAGLKELAGLKSLQSLILTGTKVTDMGLKELAGFKSLKNLWLLRTKVTQAGVEELRKALPKCYIAR